MKESIEEIYAKMPKIQQLWVDLSRAQWKEKEGESLAERLSTPPWDSSDPEIKNAWDALTAPENLAELEKWGEKEMNPRARECTDKALEACKKRIKLEQTAAG